jgi:hypothetical protein
MGCQMWPSHEPPPSSSTCMLYSTATAVSASVALEEFLDGAGMDACGAGNYALPGDGLSIPSLFICSEAFM